VAWHAGRQAGRQAGRHAGRQAGGQASKQCGLETQFDVGLVHLVNDPWIDVPLTRFAGPGLKPRNDLTVEFEDAAVLFYPSSVPMLPHRLILCPVSRTWPEQSVDCRKSIASLKSWAARASAMKAMNL
jgi:hypothetical protein